MSTPINEVKAEVAKAKTWYASHLFLAGAIVGFILALVVSHFV